MKRQLENSASLSEVNATVETNINGSKWKRLFAFLGPAYLVSVGYMDPGNWATDLAGGSKFGYTLIWVLLMSNLIALLLQSLSARLGIVRGRDLAQASREVYDPFTNMFLYILAEIAIAACDLAEVLGMAIGLQLLFGIPLMWGVTICVLDTFLLLFMINYGMRKMEAFIISLVAMIGFCFLGEMIFAKPEIGEIVKGFMPAIPNSDALYIAIGIIGATVMPHNLYLHSALVQSRKFQRTTQEIKRAIKFNILDSTIALNLAFFVNAAILILAASVFFKNGLYEVAEIQDAHKLLEPMLGNQFAPILFAVALIAAGQSSTITGTLAGQIVMEGYLNLRIQPWIRRLLTRIIAIVPALIAINIMGESATGKLLILSQVILSLQLGFAIIPLIHFVSDKAKMGEFKIRWHVQLLAWLSASVIVGLNIKLVLGQIEEWLIASNHHWAVLYIVVPLTLFAGVMLIVTIIKPFYKNNREKASESLHHNFIEISEVETKKFSRIAVSLDFTSTDNSTLKQALILGGKDATYILIHSVETVGALVMGEKTSDYETHFDRENILRFKNNLIQLGYNCEAFIGFGNPKKVIPQLTTENNADLLVMGAHGHHFIKDLIFGTTINSVRHKLKIPVMVVR